MVITSRGKTLYNSRDHSKLAPCHIQVTDSSHGEGKVPVGSHGVTDEDMEGERWGEDEEVGMDVDLTAEEELSLMTEISRTRSTLAVTCHTPSILKETACPTPYYTVRCCGCFIATHTYNYNFTG